MYHHQTCDVKTMCYIVFISHSLHWHYIKTALQEYVINKNKEVMGDNNDVEPAMLGQFDPSLKKHKRKKCEILLKDFDCAWYKFLLSMIKRLENHQKHHM